MIETKEFPVAPEKVFQAASMSEPRRVMAHEGDLHMRGAMPLTRCYEVEPASEMLRGHPPANRACVRRFQVEALD